MLRTIVSSVSLIPIVAPVSWWRFVPLALVDITLWTCTRWWATMWLMTDYDCKVTQLKGPCQDFMG
ncbi:hypothetical protein [Hoylesella loescheii]|uniref:hypothetical protein n=1 Tax=Hoylesella loescheii TaxID=840 RepID=UPI0026EB2D32|nr:hypothetical protein [Hoylesella loescheii]